MENGVVVLVVGKQ